MPGRTICACCARSDCNNSYSNSCHDLLLLDTLRRCEKWGSSGHELPFGTRRLAATCGHPLRLWPATPMQGPMQTLDAAPGVQVVAILISRHQSRHCLQARRAITLPEWTFR